MLEKTSIGVMPSRLQSTFVSSDLPLENVHQSCVNQTMDDFDVTRKRESYNEACYRRHTISSLVTSSKEYKISVVEECSSTHKFDVLILGNEAELMNKVRQYFAPVDGVDSSSLVSGEFTKI